MAVYLYDHEQKTLKTRMDLQDYLDFRKEHDIRVSPSVNECSVVGIDACTSPTSIKQESGISVSDTMYNEAGLSDTKLLLIFPKDYAPVVYPVRYTALPDICGRAGLYGRTVTETEPGQNIQVLPALLRGQWFSTGFSLNLNSCSILIRDNKISSMKSQRYKPFPEWEMIESFEKELANCWPEYRYQTGTVSHEYLSLEYHLNCREMEEEYRQMLEDFGHNVSSIYVGVSFVTSDVGSSSVSAAPFISLNGMNIRLGERAYVRHETGNSVEDFEEIMRDIASSFRSAKKRITELGSIKIFNPGDCFWNIVEDFKLPKTEAKTIAEELAMTFSISCNAIDIYVYLSSIVTRKAAELTVTALIKLQEQIAKLLFIDYALYDKPNI